MAKNQETTKQDLTPEELFYYWLVISINPYEKGLDLNKTLPPSGGASALLTQWTDNGKMNFFPNPALNNILSALIQGGCKPYKTKKGRTISCVEDIKELWKETGLQKEAGLQTLNTPEGMKALLFSVITRITAIQAYLSPQIKERQGKEKGLVPETPQRSNEASEEYDVFLCHASEDKKSFVRPLAEALRKRGLRVWYDEFSLKLGNRLRESIERGLNKSRYGVIVLSKDFFRKEWPREELDGLFSLEKKILPVWHGVNKEEVKNYSPILATRVATETSKGLPYVAEKIIEVVRPNASYKLPLPPSP